MSGGSAFARLRTGASVVLFAATVIMVARTALSSGAPRAAAPAGARSRELRALVAEDAGVYGSEGWVASAGAGAGANETLPWWAPSLADLDDESLPCDVRVAYKYNCTNDDGSLDVGCSSIVQGFINYLTAYECLLGDAKWLAWILYVVWFVFLIYIFGNTAQEYFCPALDLIVLVLNMSPNLAGVTFLSFGNGANDVFASVVATLGGQLDVGVSAVVGAGVFITTIIVGSVALISEVKLDRRPFLRDCGFFIIATSYLLYCFADNQVTYGEAIGFIVLYAVFAAVVVIGRKIYQSRKATRLAEERAAAAGGDKEGLLSSGSSSSSSSSSSSPSPSADEKWRDALRHMPHQHHFDDKESAESHARHHGAHGHTHADGTEHHHHPTMALVAARRQEMRVAALHFTDMGTDIVESPRPGVHHRHHHHHGPEGSHSIPDGAAAASPSLNASAADLARVPLVGSSTDPLADHFRSHRTTKGHSHSHGEGDGADDHCDHDHDHDHGDHEHCDGHSHSGHSHGSSSDDEDEELDACAPYCGDDTTLGKILNVVLWPSNFLRQISVPLLQEDTYVWKWCIITPLFGWPVVCIAGFGSIVNWTEAYAPFSSHAAGIDNPLAISAIVGAASMIAAFFLLPRDTPPQGRTLVVMTLFAFLTSCSWILIVANEVVTQLTTVGYILGVSPDVLGLTILAWGNSCNDFVADVTVARAGKPKMAIAATFAGPLFNVLIGLGLSLTIGCAKNNGVIHIQNPTCLEDPTHQIDLAYLSLIFCLISLVASFIVIPLSGFYVRRWWGACLLALYATFLGVSFWVEFDKNPPFIFQKEGSPARC